jgi:hypothetical protein
MTSHPQDRSNALLLAVKTSQDSTVLRNVGLPLAHTAIALASIQRGLGKLLVNKAPKTEKTCGKLRKNGSFKHIGNFWGIFCLKITSG